MIIRWACARAATSRLSSIRKGGAPAASRLLFAIFRSSSSAAESSPEEDMAAEFISEVDRLPLKWFLNPLSADADAAAAAQPAVNSARKPFIVRDRSRKVRSIIVEVRVAAGGWAGKLPLSICDATL